MKICGVIEPMSGAICIQVGNHWQHKDADNGIQIIWIDAPVLVLTEGKGT